MSRTFTKPQSKSVRPVVNQIYLIEAYPAYINQHSPELNDRENMLEEYIAGIGYHISNYIKEKDRLSPKKWIVDFFNDKSKDSKQAAYKLMRYVPKTGKFNSLDAIPAEMDNWYEWYRELERMGNTLAVISDAQSLNIFGNNFCELKKLRLPADNIFINNNNNYFFVATENWKGQPIPKYDSTQQKTYLEIQSQLRKK